MNPILSFLCDFIVASFPESARKASGEVSDALIERAIADTNARTNQLILEMAAKYPELDKAGVFLEIIAQYTIYMSAATNGPAWARRIAEDAVIAFEYDQPDNHAA